MTESMEQIIARKLERRKQLAALPVGEKLRMLEEMVAPTKAISVSQPSTLAHPVLEETAGNLLSGSSQRNDAS